MSVKFHFFFKIVLGLSGDGCTSHDCFQCHQMTVPLTSVAVVWFVCVAATTRFTPLRFSQRSFFVLCLSHSNSSGW